ncbi:MAG: hypothetical protein OXH94_13035 [Rhodospirillales bacterium]|nr:hypothetical protein [Rhodospirillales bacterium]
MDSAKALAVLAWMIAVLSSYLFVNLGYFETQFARFGSFLLPSLF